MEALVKLTPVTTDEEMMRLCLDLARAALEKGDSPVGPLIVKDGRIVSRGVEAVKARIDPTAHAEVEALRAACEGLRTLDLSGSVLYTNVEPCWMCSYAIRQTRIARGQCCKNSFSAGSVANLS